jgi:DNA-binding transcriptional ArsR family regulator
MKRTVEDQSMVFKALADESRRHLLDQLRRQDGLTLTELCLELKMSRQAVTKHLLILEAANLVVPVQRGRNKHHYLNPVPLLEILDRWTDKFRQHQAGALIDLKKQLERDNERE